MALVSNIRTYGLIESMVASGYPMKTKPPTEKEFIDECVKVVADSYFTESPTGNFTESPTGKRVENLASTSIGSGHDNFLNGMLVQFDLNFTVKAWTEAQRYHFFDFVSSMSSMHRLKKMDFDEVFCSYVTENTRNEMKRLKAIYEENPTIENELSLLYNCPTGLQLTARMTTNYRQLKTIYNQRKNHRLPEWREFCEFIKTLPYSELIVGKDIE